MRHRLSIAAACVLFACSSNQDAPSDPADAGPPGNDSGSPAACTVVPPTACPTPAPTYADVQPIFARRCVSCHSGATPSGPWPLRDYDHIVDWADTINAEIRTCSMPPRDQDSGPAMPDDERVALLTWILCGSPK